MQYLVAVPTKCDQIDFRVVTKSALPPHMMDIQISERSTLLAAPTVAFEDRATQNRIRPRHRSNSRYFL